MVRTSRESVSQREEWVKESEDRFGIVTAGWGQKQNCQQKERTVHKGNLGQCINNVVFEGF